MRIFVPLVGLLLLVLTGYAYLHNPDGCAKLGHDFVAIFTETSTGTDSNSSAPSVPSANATPIAETKPTPNTPPAVAQSPASPTSIPTTPVPSQPFKRWSPPSVIPAQPNWTWTTSDEKTYQNVVITKIEPDTVAITHSLGVTHVDIATLPADIQKQLNYDPDAASTERAELKREQDHPYFPMTDIAGAEALASQRHWPITWLFSGPEAFTVQNPRPDTWEGLTLMALNKVKTQTVVIFEKGNDELPLVPPAVIAELFHMDDGPIEGGHHYYPPKLVFSNADATKTFGRVSFTQMKASGGVPIDTILSSIHNDPDAQAILNGQPAPTSSPTPAAGAN